MAGYKEGDYCTSGSCHPAHFSDSSAPAEKSPPRLPQGYINTDVSDIFARFAGREVAAREVEIDAGVYRKKKPFQQTVSPASGKKVWVVDDNDPAMKEFVEKAEQIGWHVSISLPAWPPLEHHTDWKRVNNEVERGADGKFRLGKKFELG